MSYRFLCLVRVPPHSCPSLNRVLQRTSAPRLNGKGSNDVQFPTVKIARLVSYLSLPMSIELWICDHDLNFNSVTLPRHSKHKREDFVFL